MVAPPSVAGADQDTVARPLPVVVMTSVGALGCVNRLADNGASTVGDDAK